MGHVLILYLPASLAGAVPEGSRWLLGGGRGGCSML